MPRGECQLAAPERNLRELQPVLALLHRVANVRVTSRESGHYNATGSFGIYSTTPARLASQREAGRPNPSLSKEGNKKPSALVRTGFVSLLSSLRGVGVH